MNIRFFVRLLVIISSLYTSASAQRHDTIKRTENFLVIRNDTTDILVFKSKKKSKSAPYARKLKKGYTLFSTTAKMAAMVELNALIDSALVKVFDKQGRLIATYKTSNEVGYYTLSDDGFLFEVLFEDSDQRYAKRFCFYEPGKAMKYYEPDSLLAGPVAVFSPNSHYLAVHGIPYKYGKGLRNGFVKIWIFNQAFELIHIYKIEDRPMCEAQPPFFDKKEPTCYVNYEYWQGKNTTKASVEIEINKQRITKKAQWKEK